MAFKIILGMAFLAVVASMTVNERLTIDELLAQNNNGAAQQATTQRPIVSFRSKSTFCSGWLI